MVQRLRNGQHQDVYDCEREVSVALSLAWRHMALDHHVDVSIMDWEACQREALLRMLYIERRLLSDRLTNQEMHMLLKHRFEDVSAGVHAKHNWSLICFYARLVGKLAVALKTWHAEASERTYAPGGLGFQEARADFEERVCKAHRH